MYLADFKHILTLKCYHSYFDNGNFRVVHFGFNKASKKLSDDLQLVLKKIPGGFHLLAADTEILDDLSEITLRLYFDCNDSRFINYTKLEGFKPQSQLIYFNNIDVHPTGNALEYKLHGNKFVGSECIADISFGNVYLDEASSSHDVQFRDAFGNELNVDFIQQNPNSKDEFKLTNFEEGPVFLQQQGKDIQQVYLNSQKIWKAPLGVVDIHLETLIKQWSAQETVQYVLHFENRQTIWKYFLDESTFGKFDKLCILNKKKELLFNDPQPFQLSNEQQFILFEGKSQLELKEQPKEVFQLVENFNPEQRSGKVIVKNLAPANAEQLFREKKSNSEIDYSHIYIY